MRAINEGVYDWNVAEGTIYYSERVRAATGMTPEVNRTPQDWRARIHPDDLPKYDEALVDHFKRRTERFECDYRFRALDDLALGAPARHRGTRYGRARCADHRVHRRHY